MKKLIQYICNKLGYYRITQQPTKKVVYDMAHYHIMEYVESFMITNQEVILFKHQIKDQVKRKIDQMKREICSNILKDDNLFEVRTRTDVNGEVLEVKLIIGQKPKL